MLDPANVALFVPANLKKFKLELFNRIGNEIVRQGGRVIRHDAERLDELPTDIIPIVGCQPESTLLIAKWRQSKREWIYWDRGYVRRVFACWLPRGTNGGYYRWHRNAFQLRQIAKYPPDRWAALNIDVRPWQRGGRHIVIAAPTATYSRFHRLAAWTDTTLDTLSRLTDRQLVIRGKETRRPLQADLEGAHALVAHASIAAVEAVICGCPVFVHPDSAASLVGQTDLAMIEKPAYPERQPWLNALAFSQFSERELIDGTLFRLIT
jgi:hypothetical protein